MNDIDDDIFEAGLDRAERYVPWIVGAVLFILFCLFMWRFYSNLSSLGSTTEG